MPAFAPARAEGDARRPVKPVGRVGDEIDRAASPDADDRALGDRGDVDVSMHVKRQAVRGRELRASGEDARRAD
jgi:hypothetical protein